MFIKTVDALLYERMSHVVKKCELKNMNQYTDKVPISVRASVNIRYLLILCEK